MRRGRVPQSRGIAAKYLVVVVGNIGRGTHMVALYRRLFLASKLDA